MTNRSTGPACGNNPNYRMSDGDRRVVEGFKAYLGERTALRDRIAAAIRGLNEGGTLADLDEDADVMALANAVLAVLPPPVDRAAVLREAADALTPHLGTAGEAADGEMHDATILWAAALLRRMADETQPEPATACAHCGGDHSWDDCKAYTALVAANETQPAQAPAAEPEETDEQRADREETERDHARGDHTYCGITCEIEMPTEHLRNFVIAKGYPGTKGALDELERRAHAEAAAELPARIDRMRPEFTEHASIAAIDAQLDRARRQERRWHLRVEWLIGLRQARTEQPAAGARQDGATPDFTSPIAGRIEVRQPCPYCGDHQMIPRHQFAEHVARLHPDARQDGAQP